MYMIAVLVYLFVKQMLMFVVNELQDFTVQYHLVKTSVQGWQQNEMQQQ